MTIGDALLVAAWDLMWWVLRFTDAVPPLTGASCWRARLMRGIGGGHAPHRAAEPGHGRRVAWLALTSTPSPQRLRRWSRSPDLPGRFIPKPVGPQGDWAAKSDSRVDQSRAMPSAMRSLVRPEPTPGSADRCRNRLHPFLAGS